MSIKNKCFVDRSIRLSPCHVCCLQHLLCCEQHYLAKAVSNLYAMSFCFRLVFVDGSIRFLPCRGATCSNSRAARCTALPRGRAIYMQCPFKEQMFLLTDLSGCRHATCAAGSISCAACSTALPKRWVIYMQCSFV